MLYVVNCISGSKAISPLFLFLILFSFEVKEVIPFPSEDELRAHTAIPNIVFPSDHIACVADLRWRRDKGEKGKKKT